MQGIYGPHILHADQAGHNRGAFLIAQAHGEVYGGTAHHQVSGLHFPAVQGLSQHVVGGDILHIIEFSQVQAPVLEFGPRLDDGIPVQIGHHHLAGDYGVDGEKDAAAFLHCGAGLGLLPVHHARTQPANKDGVHHLHAHVGGRCQLFRLGYGEVGEIRCRDGFSVTGDGVEADGGQHHQYHDDCHRRQDILEDPVIFESHTSRIVFYSAKLQKIIHIFVFDIIVYVILNEVKNLCMGKCSFIFLFLLAILSCQKEKVYDPDQPSGGNFFGFDVGEVHYTEAFEYRTSVLNGQWKKVLVECAYNSARDSIGIYGLCGGEGSIRLVWIQLPVSGISERSTILLEPHYQRCVFSQNGDTHQFAEVVSGQLTVKVFDPDSPKHIFAGSFEMEAIIDGELFKLNNGYFDVSPGDGKIFRKCKESMKLVETDGVLGIIEY